MRQLSLSLSLSPSFSLSTNLNHLFLLRSLESLTGEEHNSEELAAAIESGNAEAQVEANKRIAQLAFENAKLEAA